MKLIPDLMAPTHFPHKSASVKYDQLVGSIGVLESPDNHMPIGIANCRTWDERGLAVWELIVGEKRFRDGGLSLTESSELSKVHDALTSCGARRSRGQS